MLELFRDRPVLNFSLIKIILGISFCFASLISLKTTFGLFSGVFYTLILIFICVSRTFTKNFLYFIFVFPFLSLMFTAPWMFFSLQHYALKQSTNKPLRSQIIYSADGKIAQGLSSPAISISIISFLL